jgi:hypothetical protein
VEAADVDVADVAVEDLHLGEAEALLRGLGLHVLELHR